MQLSDTLVITRTDPDVDGLACAVAHSLFLTCHGSPAAPWIPGRMDAEARYVLSRTDHVSFAGAADASSVHSLVLVDASSLDGFPAELSPDSVRMVIDHRAHHNAGRDFPRAVLRIEPVGAAATLIAEDFLAAGPPLNRDVALLLYAAIMSNTQCLRGSVSTERDASAVDWLLSSDLVPEDLLDGQLSARRADVLSDIPAAVQREQKTYTSPDGAYAVAQLEFPGANDALTTAFPQFLAGLAMAGPRAMLNLVDPIQGASTLLIPDNTFRAFVADILGVMFDGPIARFPRAILRKQIVARLAGRVW